MALTRSKLIIYLFGLLSGFIGSYFITSFISTTSHDRTSNDIYPHTSKLASLNNQDIESGLVHRHNPNEENLLEESHLDSKLGLVRQNKDDLNNLYNQKKQYKRNIDADIMKESVGKGIGSEFKSDNIQPGGYRDVNIRFHPVGLEHKEGHHHSEHSIPDNIPQQHFQDEHRHEHDQSGIAKDLYNKVRILCWIMTSPENHEKKAVHVLATWGKRCNKILFISEQLDKSLPIVKVNVSHGREHLTAKTMAAFDHIYAHHLDEADWFLKADDDTYVIVENLRYFLSGQRTADPVYFGHHFKPYVSQGYFSGGGGYVLSREALRRFGLRDRRLCSADDGAEDVEMGQCMQNVKVKVGDSRDNLGRSRFHCFDPGSHVHGQYPEWYLAYDKYGAKKGIESISDYAITFHYVSVEKLYNLDFYVYHLRPYGIVSALQNLNVPLPYKSARNGIQSQLPVGRLPSSQESGLNRIDQKSAQKSPIDSNGSDISKKSAAISDFSQNSGSKLNSTRQKSDEPIIETDTKRLKPISNNDLNLNNEDNKRVHIRNVSKNEIKNESLFTMTSAEDNIKNVASDNVNKKPSGEQEEVKIQDLPTSVSDEQNRTSLNSRLHELRPQADGSSRLVHLSREKNQGIQGMKAQLSVEKNMGAEKFTAGEVGAVQKEENGLKRRLRKRLRTQGDSIKQS